MIKPKFRAWDRKKEEWCFDFRLHPDGTIMNAEKSSHNNGLEKWEYSTEENKNLILNQYKEREDKNGKNIFSGDIIRNNSGAIYIERLFESAKRIKEPTNALTDFLWEEICGNVYENKDLLKEKYNEK